MSEVNSNDSQPVVIPRRRNVGEVSTFDVARAYLEAMHVTSWPKDSWQIRELKGQDAAAAWVTQLVDDINAIRNMVVGSTTNMTIEEAAMDWRRMKEGR